jgi:hypothetical protein
LRAGDQFHNHRYRLQSAEHRTVTCDDTIDVGPGQFLVMNAPDIHSTEVVGAASTLHLHLYGRRLNAVPPFESRRYVTAPAVPAGFKRLV